MSEVIKRLEYEEIEISESPNYQQVTESCAKLVIDSAIKYGCKKEGEWFTYKRTNTQILKCGGWVGTLQCDSRQIEVRPKIENVEGADTQVDLIELLIKAGIIDAEFREVANLADRATVFDLLVLWYAKKISRECNRGLSRGYTEVSDNIACKRGRIDFSKEWENRAKKRLSLACSFDEHSEDNMLNRILKAGLKAAHSSRTNLPECRIAISNALKLLEGIKDITISPQTAKNFKPDRKDLRFRPLLLLASRFIANKSHKDIQSNESSTKDSAGLSLMWSAWSLFESYVYRELAGENPNSKFAISKEKWSIKKQVTGIHMIRRNGAEHGTDYLLKPDIIIYDDSGIPVMICDTKWKYDIRNISEDDATQIIGKRGKFIIKKSDLYQMFAYSRYYAQNGQNPTIALIYPTQKNTCPERNSKSPLSFLTKVDTLFYNIGENKTQTAVEIYEFPVPTVSK